MRVLLVEDDISFAELVQHTLAEDPETRTVRVPTWREAERMLTEGQFDCVVLDLGLPDSQGPDTLQRVLDTRPDVAVVVVSGAIEDREDRLKLLRAGAQLALPKDGLHLPSLADDLRSAVARQDFLSRIEFSRRSEVASRQQAERDLAWFDDLRRTTNSVSAQALGLRPVFDVAPGLFDSLVDAYDDLIDGAVRRFVYREQPHMGPKVRAYANQIASLRLGPREITEIHTAALRRKAETGETIGNTHINVEGRLLLVEVMGYVLSAYRNFTLASGNRSRISGESAQPGSSPTT